VQCAQEFLSESPPVRKLVAKLPTPRGDHREDKLSAIVQQPLVDVRVVLADRLGNMGEVELDRSAAARLKVDEQRAVLRAEHIAWMRLAVKQLLHGAAVVDRPSQASQPACLPLRKARSASASPGERSASATTSSASVIRSVNLGLGTSTLRMPACNCSSALA
jgi:hypothetical protein